MAGTFPDSARVDVPVEFLERAVFVPGANALVLSDLHVGKAAASRVEAPIDDGSDVIDRLERLLGCVDAETVVVAGDLLHSFSTVPRGADWTVTRLERIVADAGAEFVVTPGNHDGMLEAVYDGHAPDAYMLADGETLVCHGHEQPDLERVYAESETEFENYEGSNLERVVVGHDHPALSVGGRKLPCFLYARDAWRGLDVLMLPAFTRSASGVTINRARGIDLQSPMVRSLEPFHPVIRDDSAGETRWFPPIEACRHLL
ncbi:metallophosphoesterase [Natronosalvus rutilus]|uniref:Metallophosphoesterase n=1 Tax=Natronosalvus rutilus TaxID=2953753 RepID=A0A9E7NBH9_9EURY|nr:metallophosphoesterase [Natronosalvus rutilus]UTF53632.1 metallophosphoesterase [Natronosalvus rutilus]